jgi:hypothetical protein
MIERSLWQMPFATILTRASPAFRRREIEILDDERSLALVENGGLHALLLTWNSARSGSRTIFQYS